MNDIIGELSQGYLPIRYHTRQRILIPIQDESEGEKENAEAKTAAAASISPDKDKEKEKESPSPTKKEIQISQFTAGVELVTERAEKRKMSASIKVGNGELVVLKNSQGEK